MKLIVRDVWTHIEGDLSTYATKLVDDPTSYKVHGRWFSQAFKRGHWDGITRFREFDQRAKSYRFPTGFLTRVTENLDAANYPYTLEDERTCIVPDPVYKLRGAALDEGKWSFQGEVLDAALTHGRGVIKVPTGGGKTNTGAAIIASYQVPTVWLTHRKVLLYQTKKVLEQRLGCKVGVIGDGQLDPQEITVAMVQSVNKRESAAIDSVLATAELVIADEVHHVESGSGWYKALMRCHAPYRFGLTASPCLDGAGMHIIAATGDLIAEIDVGDLVEAGVLVEPHIWVSRVPGEKRLPAKSPYATVYAQGIVGSIARNEQIVHVARLLKAEGKNCLTLVRQIKHGEILADMMDRADLKVAFIHGKVSHAERDRYLEKLWSKDLDHVVAQSEVMGEGVDLPFLEAIINATGTRGGGSKGSSVEHEVGRGTIQYLGRGLRAAPGKTIFEYFDFLDTSHKMLAQAARERVRTLEEEGWSAYVKYYEERPANAELKG